MSLAEHIQVHVAFSNQIRNGAVFLSSRGSVLSGKELLCCTLRKGFLEWSIGLRVLLQHSAKGPFCSFADHDQFILCIVQ